MIEPPSASFGATPLAPVTAFRRFSLLLGLRRRLLFRGPRKGLGAKLIFFVVVVQLLVFAILLGGGAATVVSERPELADNLARVACLGFFGLQLVLGVMGVAVSEFYDTSRLLHLPIAPREIFSAMSVSAIFSPMAALAAAPFVGVLIAREAGRVQWVFGIACVVGLLWFAHAASLLIGYVFLRYVSRRRLRDLSTVVGSAVGVLFFVGFRALGDLGSDPDAGAFLTSERWAAMRFAPFQWFAEAFVSIETRPDLAWRYAGCGVVAIWIALRLGSAAFRATYDAGGDATADSAEVAEVRAGFARFLPRDVAAVVQTTHAIFRREPQLRALLIQQLVFIAFPIVMQMGSEGKGRPGGDVLVYVVAGMIVFSHAAIATSVFGLDGRGLAMLFAAPMARGRLIAGRLIALAGVFAAADLLSSAAIVGITRSIRKDFDGALTEAGLLYGLAMTGDVVQLACGAVVSIVVPMRVVRTRRGSAPRLGKEGCVTALGRMFALIPTAACVAVAVAIVAAPKWLGLDDVWYAASVPAALAYTGLLVYACVMYAARLLATREEALLTALADDGE